MSHSVIVQSLVVKPVSLILLCLCLGSVAAALSGCVTEYSGGTQMSADPDATVEKRVSLARQYIGVGDWENAKRNLELAQQIRRSGFERHPNQCEHQASSYLPQ